MRSRTYCLTVVATAVLSGALAWWVSRSANAHPDFEMLWSAVRSSHPYDQHALAVSLNRGGGSVAFVNPPTALPLLAPFSLIPMRLALVFWATMSGAATALAARSRWAPILVLTPAALWALPGGQTSLVLGSMLLGSILLMDEHPSLSGALLGLVACIKPQLAVVIAAALLFNRKWIILAIAATCLIVSTLVSASIFGIGQWGEWARSLPGFLALHAQKVDLRSNEIAPNIPTWVRIALLAIGVPFTIAALRRGDRIAAFITSTGIALIGAPHAMGYEFALFTPAIPNLMQRGRLAVAATALFILMPAIIWSAPEMIRFLPRLATIILLIAACEFPSCQRGTRRGLKVARHYLTFRRLS